MVGGGRSGRAARRVPRVHRRRPLPAGRAPPAPGDRRLRPPHRASAVLVRAARAGQRPTDCRGGRQLSQPLIVPIMICNIGGVTLTESARGAAGLLEDHALIARIFEHIDHGTTDLGETTWREPVANYLRA